MSYFSKDFGSNVFYALLDVHPAGLNKEFLLLCSLFTDIFMSFYHDYIHNFS